MENELKTVPTFMPRAPHRAARQSQLSAIAGWRKQVAALIVTVVLPCAGAAENPPVERWIHPTLTHPTLQLPGVFDQQTVVTLGDGRLMTIDPKGNATLTSTDGGRTWSEPRVIRAESSPVVPKRGPLIRTRAGTLIFLFQDMAGLDLRWDEVQGDWRSGFRSDLWVMSSRDDGKTWSEPKRPFNGIYGTITGSVQTRQGQIVIPIQIALKEPGRWGTYAFVSADEGQTWSRSNLIDLGGKGHHDGAIESAITDLSDGRLLMLIRTSLDRFWEAYSDDQGLNWRELRRSQLDATSAPGNLRRLASGRLVLVWNRMSKEGQPAPTKSAPSASYAYGARSQRGELSLSYSDDDAKTWAPPVVIARQSKGSISYPFVFESAPGEIWVWTRYGSSPPVYMKLKEADLERLGRRRLPATP